MNSMGKGTSLSSTALLKLLGIGILLLFGMAFVSGIGAEPSAHTAQVAQAVSASEDQDIEIGEHVTATYKVTVRDSADGRKVGSQRLGKQGEVVEGPIEASGYTWWYVDWEWSATDGWTEEGYLANLYMPSLSVSADPQNVPYGGETRISWVARHVSDCTMRGTGLDATGTRGSTSSPALYADTTYSLLCATNEAGKTIQHVLIRVGLPPTER